VIQIARAFCQAIGQPVTTSGTAVFPRPMIGPDGEESYSAPRWSVVFPGQAEVDVVDGSGMVSWYKNDKIDTLDEPAGTAESSSLALLKFDTVIAASGADPLSIGQPSATETQGDFPPSEMEHYWNVVAQRQYQGIPFEDQRIMAYVQAETGQLYIYSFMYSTPAPTSNVQTITSSQAQNLATTVLSNVGLQTINFDSASLAVVQPNDLFGPISPAPLRAVVVWNCVFDDSTPTEDATGLYNVWISADDGSVQGGEVFVNESQRKLHGPHRENTRTGANAKIIKLKRAGKIYQMKLKQHSERHNVVKAGGK